jgi:hypothetical protein
MATVAKPTEVAILTNFIPPTRLPAFQFIARQLNTRLFLDTDMEDNRKWTVETGGLNAHVVWGLSLPVYYRHPQGFREKSYLHLPLGLFWSLLKANPQRIISGELGFRTGIACLYRVLRPKTQLVVWVEGTPHTDASRGRLRRWWRSLIVRIPDCFLATSTGAKELLISYGVPEKLVHVAFLLTSFYPPPRVPDRDSTQRRRLLYCGALNERKGVRKFVEALVSVFPALGVAVELWFAGEGPDEAFLRSLPLPPGLSFRFLGFVPFERMPETYKQCGVLVFPTLADVWGLVVNEAMMYGLPVLGSRYAQSVCDLVTDGQTGWTFLPDDPASVESAIRIALSAGNEELENMGSAARKSIEHLTPEAFGDDLLRCFA